jgi:HD-GYP domain-containing protein (c-di-GMP phosphodiesterase class II)
MTTDRAYRKALPHVIARGEMEAVAAPQFDLC